MTHPTYEMTVSTRPSIQVLAADGRPAPVPNWLESSDIGMSGASVSILLVTLDSQCQVPVSLISGASETETVLVLGPCGEITWREKSLAAGAFGCVSAATLREDKLGLLRCAIQYSVARSETRSLRQYCDRLCGELVQSFADAMAKLASSQNEAGHIRRTLEDIQLRVLRSLM